ncbi:hypothetical protein [Candidatus Contendibacter odensensis]|uniref:hypothetical protein n=1 Tax=Candidatus Contendibacter odensensis TaxID=1400860 RepID=UPI0012B6839F|nr:hypothetical protein [Candidatus Contendobacter odensis]
MASKIRSEMVLVTPEMATKYLSCNEQNRRVRLGWVDCLATSIKNGEWQFTHQGIAFSETGRLLDGQHRLMAIAKAGIPVSVIITHGLDDNTFAAIDCGIRRTDEDLTRLPKFTVEATKLLITIMNFDVNGYLSRSAKKTTPAQIHLYADIIGVFCDLLLKKAPTKAAIFSSTPVRLAAIYAMMTGESLDYVISTYRKLVLRDTASMSPICHSAVRQVLTGTVTTRGGDDVRIENFARFIAVFKETNKNVLKLKARDRTTVIQEVRKELKHWFSSEVSPVLKSKIETVRSSVYEQMTLTQERKETA